MLTGLAGDAFPSQGRALSGSAYPAFSLQGLQPCRRDPGGVRGSESLTPDAGRRRSGCPQLSSLWSGRRTGAGAITQVLARQSGCPRRSMRWSGVRVSAISGRPVGRRGGPARNALSRDEAPGSDELDASSTRRSVSKSGERTAQRRAAVNDDSGRRRVAHVAGVVGSIRGPVLARLGAGCEPGPAQAAFYISPKSRSEAMDSSPTTTWSRSSMPRTSPPLTRRRVSWMSAPLGVGSPLGWL